MQLVKRRLAFTLIELLVVVTIIVVLLSLLTPALDKAIYQAELAVCGANYKLLANSSILYAYSFHRNYPYRDLPAKQQVDGLPGMQAHQLRRVGNAGGKDPVYDIRPMLRPYVSINKSFNDPFCEQMDYDNADPAVTLIWTSVFYWWGWYYNGRPGILKVGDRFTAADFEDTATPVKTVRLSLLGGDIDGKVGANPAVMSHPDFEGAVSVTTNNATWIESQWRRYGSGGQRAPLDLNFAYDDGSVIRKSHVENSAEDMVRIYNFNLETRDGGDIHVPWN